MKEEFSKHTEEKKETEDKDENSNICKRCGYEREHDRINHCGRCNRCVDFMDHHCFFTDNCVGKKNYRYFFAFIFWADFTLFSAMGMLVWKFHTFNVEDDYGAKSLYHALSSQPNSLWLIFGYNEAFEYVGWGVAARDGILFCCCMALAGIVTFPGYYTLKNVRYRTSEVLKFKAKMANTKKES